MDPDKLDRLARRAGAIHQGREQTQRQRLARYRADKDAYFKECEEQIEAMLDLIQAANGAPLYINTTGLHDYVCAFLRQQFNYSEKSVFLRFN